MRKALLRKELRSLRPFLFVVLAIVLLDTIDALLRPLGLGSFPARLVALSGELTMLQILLGFALGGTLLVREVDDGTLNFLDGLPLTRRAIFAAKFQSALLVLMVAPACLLLLNAGLHLATRGSLDAPVRPVLLFTFFALSMLVTVVALTAGMALGFLRYLAWLVLVLCAVGIKLMEESAPSLSAALNPAELLTLRFTGTHWQLPMPTIWTQLAAALLFGVAAFVLFSTAGRVRARVQGLNRGRRWLRTSLVTVMVIAAGSGIVILGGRHMDDGEKPGAAQAKGVDFMPIASGHASTSHYSFSYPALSGGRVAPLIKDADGIFSKVAGLLRIDGGAAIDVDLSGSTTNHAGTAYMDRIRMRASDAEAGATLAHETSHVFARRLAGGEHAGELDNMIIFNEGLAEWVEGAFKDSRAVTEKHELAAAIVSARRLVTPRQLTDQDAFASVVDDNLKYPLGAILIGRLVERYGPEAPRRILQALARDNFPRDLRAYVLWQAAFQTAGFDLDLVLDDYARHLKLLEVKYARQIAALPRPRGSLAAQEDEDEEGYVVALRFDAALPAGTRALVRFRPGLSNDTTKYRVGYAADVDGSFTVDVPDGLITRGQVCFQPGITVEDIIVYEPWLCLPVTAAGK